MLKLQATPYNSGHAATLRSAQIRKRTSYVRKSLNEIAILLEKRNELIESPFNWSNCLNGS